MTTSATTGKSKAGAGSSPLPLSTLLSQILVAFTIEFDNEFERQTPHRITASRSAAQPHGPWLVSLVMWSNFMQFVPEQGVTVGELQTLARTAKLSLAGMERWGYVRIQTGSSGKTKTKTSIRNAVVLPTAKGLRAQQVWRGLFGVIESRWRERFGDDAVDRLRQTLWELIKQMAFDLPQYLPVLRYGLVTEDAHYKRNEHAHQTMEDIPLTTLLSNVLHAFAIDFEHESKVSLAICANVLRLIDEAGVPARDLPGDAGVSKEAIHMALSFLGKRGYITIEPDPDSPRKKLIALTAQGRRAKAFYLRLIEVIEERWLAEFGKDKIRALRESLESFTGKPSALFAGLEPHPDGWRASVPKLRVLPHYPMVLHRGGYPDGS